MDSRTAVTDNRSRDHRSHHKPTSDQVGQRIRAWRTAQRMTQRRLAELTGVTISHVSSWEHGKGLPSLRSIRALRQALGVSWEALLGESGGDNDT